MAAAPTLGVIAAFVAALVTLVTFVFNYRATIRNQRDTQFYEALKRFGDQNSSVLRSSAAGLLAPMARRRSLFRNPYFDTTLDQLVMGFLSEKDTTTLDAICKAILRIADIHSNSVLNALRSSNLKLQEDVLRILANLFVLRG